jgi:hypothetical protein
MGWKSQRKKNLKISAQNKQTPWFQSAKQQPLVGEVSANFSG